mmetsp:Transcript_85521/g.250383  ORF Transcript_85521/g.250383 Transcript_85521/m.250383 type:complete len:163 (-) Transcript_85521:11-499(-)
MPGHIRWVFLQLALVLGGRLAAWPCCLVLGEPFACPQVLQPAQSAGVAGLEATSQDTAWRQARRLVHGLAGDFLVDSSQPVRAWPEAGEAKAPSVRRERLEAVVSGRWLDFDCRALAEQHAELFGRDAEGRVDGLAAPRYPPRFLRLPPPLLARAAPEAEGP